MMLFHVPRWARLLLAIAITVLFLPCFGFGVFGFLASGEAGANTTWWRMLYSVFLIFLFGGITGAWWFALHSFETDLKPGRCSRCGYDLQGTPEQRCPECGAPVTTF
jgi:hypothetical protein